MTLSWDSLWESRCEDCVRPLLLGSWTGRRGGDTLVQYAACLDLYLSCLCKRIEGRGRVQFDSDYSGGTALQISSFSGA